MSHNRITFVLSSCDSHGSRYNVVQHSYNSHWCPNWFPLVSSQVRTSVVLCTQIWEKLKILSDFTTTFDIFCSWYVLNTFLLQWDRGINDMVVRGSYSKGQGKHSTQKHKAHLGWVKESSGKAVEGCWLDRPTCFTKIRSVIICRYKTQPVNTQQSQI